MMAILFNRYEVNLENLESSEINFQPAPED